MTAEPLSDDAVRAWFAAKLGWELVNGPWLNYRHWRDKDGKRHPWAVLSGPVGFFRVVEWCRAKGWDWEFSPEGEGFEFRVWTGFDKFGNTTGADATRTDPFQAAARAAMAAEGQRGA